MTKNVFDKTGLTPNFWVDGLKKSSNSGGRISNIGGCLDSCENLDSGRFWCKAGCWIELAAVVAAVIIML
jgi:hypothetical protein